MDSLNCRRQQWMEFKTHYIEEYEKMLAANGGNTMGQEGYGNAGAYQAVEDDGSSLAQSIAQYAERATTAGSQVSDLESQLAALVSIPPPLIIICIVYFSFCLLVGVMVCRGYVDCCWWRGRSWHHAICGLWSKISHLWWRMLIEHL